MDTNDLCDNIAEWARETVGELLADYTYVPAAKPEALPDVIVELSRTFVQRGGGEQFPQWELQQMMVEGYDLELALMVDNTDPAAAAESLRDYRDLLSEAVRRQPTLTDRVHVPQPLRHV